MSLRDVPSLVFVHLFEQVLKFVLIETITLLEISEDSLDKLTGLLSVEEPVLVLVVFGVDKFDLVLDEVLKVGVVLEGWLSGWCCGLRLVSLWLLGSSSRFCFDSYSFTRWGGWFIVSFLDFLFYWLLLFSWTTLNLGFFLFFRGWFLFHFLF